MVRDPFHVGRPLTMAPAHLRLSTELLVFKWLWSPPHRGENSGQEMGWAAGSADTADKLPP